MNKFSKEVLVNAILLRLHENKQIRVSDVASWFYLSKGKARRLLDWMVSADYLKKKVIRYAGNANMNVYEK